MPAGDIGVVMRSGMRESRAMYPPLAPITTFLAMIQSGSSQYGNSCSSREIHLGSAALAVAIQYIYVYIYILHIYIYVVEISGKESKPGTRLWIRSGGSEHTRVLWGGRR